MKALLIVMALVVLGATANARSIISPEAMKRQNAAKLADIISQVLRSNSSAVTEESKALLTELIAPQDSELRTSVTLFDCGVDFSERGQVENCQIEIGTDNLSDDDSGWGTLQRISIDGVIENGKLKVEAATLFNIAG
jgi:hypothetical protein